MTDQLQIDPVFLLPVLVIDRGRRGTHPPLSGGYVHAFARGRVVCVDLENEGLVSM